MDASIHTILNTKKLLHGIWVVVEFEVVSVIIKTERKEVVKAFNQMGQEVAIDTEGLIFQVWDNGDVVKIINE